MGIGAGKGFSGGCAGSSLKKYEKGYERINWHRESPPVTTTESPWVTNMVQSIAHIACDNCENKCCRYSRIRRKHGKSS